MSSVGQLLKACTSKRYWEGVGPAPRTEEEEEKKRENNTDDDDTRMKIGREKDGRELVKCVEERLAGTGCHSTTR